MAFAGSTGRKLRTLPVPQESHRDFIRGLARVGSATGDRSVLRGIIAAHQVAVVGEQDSLPDDLRKGNRLCLNRPIEDMSRALTCAARDFPRPSSQMLISHYDASPAIPGVHFPRPYLYDIPRASHANLHSLSSYWEREAVGRRLFILTEFPAVFQGPEIPPGLAEEPTLVCLLVGLNTGAPPAIQAVTNVPSILPVPYPIKGAVQREPMPVPAISVPGGSRKRPATTDLPRPKTVKIARPSQLPVPVPGPSRGGVISRGAIRSRGRGSQVTPSTRGTLGRGRAATRGRGSTRSSTRPVQGAADGDSSDDNADPSPSGARSTPAATVGAAPTRTVSVAYQAQPVAHKRKSTGRKPFPFPAEAMPGADREDPPGSSTGNHQRRKQRRTVSSVPYDADKKRWTPFRGVTLDPESQLAVGRLPGGRAVEAETFGDTYIPAELDYVPTSFSAHTYYGDISAPLGARIHVLQQPQEFAPINAEEVGVDGFRLPVPAPPVPSTKHRNHLASSCVIPYQENAESARRELFKNRIGITVFGHPICIFVYSMWQVSHTLRLPLRETWLDQVLTDRCEREVTDTVAVALVDGLLDPQVRAKLVYLTHRHLWTLILRAGVSDNLPVIFCYLRIESLFRHHILYLTTIDSSSLTRPDGRPEVFTRRLVALIEPRIQSEFGLDMTRCLTLHFNFHSLHFTTLVKVNERWDLLHSDDILALFRFFDTKEPASGHQFFTQGMREYSRLRDALFRIPFAATSILGTRITRSRIDIKVRKFHPMYVLVFSVSFVIICTRYHCLVSL